MTAAARFIDRPHTYRRSPHSGAGNCQCGMSARWRFHQPAWWRLTHRGYWRPA